MAKKKAETDTAESTSTAFKLDQEAITPPAYSQAVTTVPISALYGGGVIPEGTPVLKAETTSADLHLKSTVWYAENPTRYFRVFDGMQNFKLQETPNV